MPVTVVSPEKKRQPATKTAAQRAVIAGLTQSVAANLLGMRPNILRDLAYDDARNADGTYDGAKLVAAHLRATVDKAVAAVKVEVVDVDALPSKERLELANAKKRELEYEIMQGRYVDRQEITNEFAEMAAAVRSELEAVGPRMENDLPADVRAEVIGELKAQHRHILRRLANRGREYDG